MIIGSNRKHSRLQFHVFDVPQLISFASLTLKLRGAGVLTARRKASSFSLNCKPFDTVSIFGVVGIPLAASVSPSEPAELLIAK